ncbi:MAG: hypothetical protein M0R77_00815 [Gammaproteobacteria bacterium]|nr:hypothetical protein [Acholeplasmataceae bacterium]MCK9529096.1 hypothetical protein [Gammaproteobacteria bacterium]
MDTQLYSVLFSIRRLYEIIPELPLLYRFLGQEDLTLVKLSLMGPQDPILLNQYRLLSIEDQVEWLAYYVLEEWEATNTVTYSTDTNLSQNTLLSLLGLPSTHEKNIRAIRDIFYPVLNLPNSNIVIDSITRIFKDCSLLETDQYAGPDYYCVNYRL